MAPVERLGDGFDDAVRDHAVQLHFDLVTIRKRYGPGSVHSVWSGVIFQDDVHGRTVHRLERDIVEDVLEFGEEFSFNLVDLADRGVGPHPRDLFWPVRWQKSKCK